MTNKKILTLISLLLFLFLMVGCKVVNQPPVITTTALPDATVGSAYTTTVAATDPDGDALTFSLVSGPTGMVISGTGVISGWTPVEADVAEGVAVKVAVTDGKVSVSAPFTITVSVAPPAQLTSIVVLPETMELVIEDSDTIVSVTAYYDDESFKSIDLENCAVSNEDDEVATVDETPGRVTAVACGTTTITVSYTEEKKAKTVLIQETDTIVVTVIDKVHNIDADLYYSTIQAAIDDARTGETIEVAAGIYEPDNTLTIDKEGLTLKSIDEYATTIIDFATLSDKIGIHISAPHVTVEGFTLKLVDGNTGICADKDVNRNSDDLTVQNNKIIQSGASSWGVILNTGVGFTLTGAVVSNNELENCAIALIRTRCSTVSNNTLTGDGMIWLDGIDSDNNTISENTVSEDRRAEYGAINFVSGTFDGNLIQGNTLSGNAGYGINIPSAATLTNLTITGNDITDNEKAGILIDTNCTWGLHNVINYNNIADNSTGISNLTTTLIDAENNWWGSEGTGVDAGSPAAGVGNNGVSDNVDFTPWSTSEF